MVKSSLILSHRLSKKNKGLEGRIGPGPALNDMSGLTEDEVAMLLSASAQTVLQPDQTTSWEKTKKTTKKDLTSPM